MWQIKSLMKENFDKISTVTAFNSGGDIQYKQLAWNIVFYG